MAERFAIASLRIGSGRVGLCPMPGAAGDYAGDLSAVVGWGPAMVVTMALSEEMARLGARTLAADLGRAGIVWRHLPVADFAAESPALAAGWAGVAEEACVWVGRGASVLFHCRGGCGRSGMAVLRLMVEAGEAPDAALARLRAVRPCAVETEAQRLWAAEASSPAPGGRTRSS